MGRSDIKVYNRKEEIKMYEVMELNLFDADGQPVATFEEAVKMDFLVELGGFRQHYGPVDITVLEGKIELGLDGEWSEIIAQ